MNQLWGELVGLRGSRSRGVEVSGFDGKARQCVKGEHPDFEVVRRARLFQDASEAFRVVALGVEKAAREQREVTATGGAVPALVLLEQRDRGLVLAGAAEQPG